MKSKKNKTKGVTNPGATDDPGPSVSDSLASGGGGRNGDADPNFDNMQTLLREYLEEVSDLNLESARTLLDQGVYLKFNKYFQQFTNVIFRFKVDRFGGVHVR